MLRLRIPCAGSDAPATTDAVADPATGAPLPITTLFTTVSSDGKINVHDLSAALGGPAPLDGSAPIAPIATYDTKGSRLVCATMAESLGKAKHVVREAADGDYEYDEGEGEGDDDLYGDAALEDEDEMAMEGEGEDELEDDE